MTLIGWASLIISFLGLLGTFILFIVRATSRITTTETEIKMIRLEINRVDKELRSHAILNEGAFLNIEKDIKSINSKLDELLGYFKATQKQPL